MSEWIKKYAWVPRRIGKEGAKAVWGWRCYYEERIVIHNWPVDDSLERRLSPPRPGTQAIRIR